MSRRALITGILGQDGAYLSALLLDRGYTVEGIVGPDAAAEGGAWRLRALGIEDAVELVDGDLRDHDSLRRALARSRPDEVYNLAARSSVADSFGAPVATGEVTAMGALRLLEAVREHAPEARVYQASSSEMFGRHATPPMNEATPLQPSSPYAVAKVYAHQMARSYREAYGMFVCCGILFNHDSPLRGEAFVTRKIARGAARIAAGLDDALVLGNVEARRDFGYAPEYVDAMWRMLQQDAPDDYVVATGESHSVRAFAEAAFAVLDLDLDAHLRTDPALLRPSDLEHVAGDARRARERLGWEATTRFPELVRILVEAEVVRARGEEWRA